MRPIGSVATHLIIGQCCVFFLCLAVAFQTGCRVTPPAAELTPPVALTDAEARKANALAHYAEGILLENGQGSSTNDTRDAALRAFRQASALDPDNRRIIAATLNNLAERRLFDEAVALLEQYLIRNPDDTELRLEAARVAEAADRPDLSAHHCAILLAAAPDNRDLAQTLVALYFQVDNEQAALETIRQQQTRFNDARSAALPVQWGIHFSRTPGNPDRAIQCFELALKKPSKGIDRSALLTLVAECQLDLGRTNAAVASLQQACQLDPDATAPVLRLGSLWALRTDAISRITKLAKQSSGSDLPALVLAATQQALGDRPAAIATLRSVYAKRMRASRFPDKRFYLWLCSLLEAERDNTSAERLLREACATYPTSHELQNFMAYLWVEQNIHLDEADSLITQALRASPDNAAYLDTKGWVLYRKARFFDALQFLLKAADLERDEPVILDHTGDVLMAIGRSDEALVFWRRSHEIEPNPLVAEKIRRQSAPATPPNP